MTAFKRIHENAKAIATKHQNINFRPEEQTPAQFGALYAVALTTLLVVTPIEHVKDFVAPKDGPILK
jgi:hypothetical protein